MSNESFKEARARAGRKLAKVYVATGLVGTPISWGMLALDSAGGEFREALNELPAFVRMIEFPGIFAFPIILLAGLVVWLEAHRITKGE